MAQNLTAKLAQYNGTLLQRLESYLRATRYPLRGNQTIASVAWTIYLYLVNRKSLEEQEMVYVGLGQHSKELGAMAPTLGHPAEEPTGPPGRFQIAGKEGGIFSEGSPGWATGPRGHAKPAVVTRSPGAIVVSLEGMRGHAERMVVRYWRAGDGGGAGELAVPGDAAVVRLHGLAPGTTYQVEIHGLVQGQLSKSYSFVASTAPEASGTEPPPTPSLPRPGPPPGDLAVTDVSPDRFRVTWTATPGTFQHFLLQYREPGSQVPPGQTQVPGGKRSVIVTQLSPGTEYEVELRGVAPDGTISEPITTSVSTEPRHPDRVTPLSLAKPLGGGPGPSDLGALGVRNVTSDGFGLQWRARKGLFQSFLLRYEDAAGRMGPREAEVLADQRATRVGGLRPGTEYNVTLYGVHRGQLSPPLRARVRTAPAEPGTQPSLGELSASDVTHDSALLSWTVQAGDFDSFLLQYKDAEGKPQALPVDGGSSTVTVTNLAPSRRYKFNLYGISGRKRLGPVSTDTVTATAPTEAVPTAQPSLGELSASDITHNSILLSWTVQAGDFDSFLLQYKDAEGKPQALPVDGGSRVVTVTNLAPSRRYKFNLYGISGHKRLGPISTDTITAAVQREEEITAEPSLGELSASDITHDSILLSWTVQAGDFDSFLLQYKDAEGKPQALPVDGGSRTVTVTNLAPSHRYNFKFYGVSGRKRLGPISTNAVTAPWKDEPTAQPSLGELSASNVTRDSILLSWTVQAGDFDSFLLQYKDKEGKPQALPMEGGSRTVTITNLAPSRRYKFNLYGVSGRKRLGPISTDTVTGAVAQGEEEPSLGELSASDVTHNSILLSWTIQAGDFDSFLLQYKDAEGKPQALPVDGGSRTVTVTNLAPSRRYKFNLYGISGRKRLGPISTDTVTAVAPREEAVGMQLRLGELSAANAGHDSIDLSWTVEEGTFDSFILQYRDAEGQPSGHWPVVVPMPAPSPSMTCAPSARYKFTSRSGTRRRRLGFPAQPGEELSASNLTHDLPICSSLDLSSAWGLRLPSSSETRYKFNLYGIYGPQAPRAHLPRRHHRSTAAPGYKINLYGHLRRKRLGPISPTPHSRGPRSGAHLPTAAWGLSAFDITMTPPPLCLDCPDRGPSLLPPPVQDSEADPGMPQFPQRARPTLLRQCPPACMGIRTVTVTNLGPLSRRYKFTFYGISGRKRLGPVSTDTVTAPWKEKPAPQPSLGELSASDVTHDSIRLSWTIHAGDFNSFLLQYKDAEGKTQALPVEGGSRTVTVTNLAPSRRYKFNLYGIYGRKRLGPISTDAITAAAPTEEVPTAQPSLGELSASDVTHDSILLSWTVQAGDFDSFLLQYKDAEGKPQGKPQALPVDGGSRTVTVTNLAPSRRYKFNLYGISGRKRLGPISTDSVTAVAPWDKGAGTQLRLGELSASNVTRDSALLSWTVEEGTFDSFILQYKDAEGKPQVLPVDGGSRTVTVTNLAPSRRYKFNLYGISGRKRLGPVSTDTITAQLPEAGAVCPRGGVAREAGNVGCSLQPFAVVMSRPRFSFSRRIVTVLGPSVPGAPPRSPAGELRDSFLLQYKDAEGKPQALPVDGGSRTVTITNLAPSRRYKFNLYGISGRKRLGPISTDTVTAPQEEGAGMQLRLGPLSASDITHDSLNLSWTVEEGTFDSFILQYRDADGKPQVLPVDGGSRTVTVTSLAPSRRYKFNLYGISGRKRLGPVSTDTVTGRPDEEQEEEEEEGATQPKLGELSTSEVTKDSVRLSWTVQAGAFDSFLLQYRDAEGKPQALPVDGGSRTLVVSDLLPSRKYKFNLYGISGHKRLGPISTDAVTAFPEASSVTPARLEQLLVSEVTPTSLRLRWDAPEGDFDTFLIRYRAEGRGPAQEVPVPGAQRSAVLRGLRPGTEYDLAVYGLRQGKETANVHGAARTSSLAGRGPRTCAFASPRDLAGVTGGPPSTHVDHYKVFLQLAPMGESRRPRWSEGTRLQTTLGALIPGASYEVSIMAMRASRKSAPLVGYVTTIPDGPSDLRAVNIADTSALLRWRPPRAPVQSYKLSYGPPQGERGGREIPGPDAASHQLSNLTRSAATKVPGAGDPVAAQHPHPTSFNTGVTSQHLTKISPEHPHHLVNDALRTRLSGEGVSKEAACGLVGPSAPEAVFASNQRFRVDPAQRGNFNFRAVSVCDPWAATAGTRGEENSEVDRTELTTRAASSRPGTGPEPPVDTLRHVSYQRGLVVPATRHYAPTSTGFRLGSRRTPRYAHRTPGFSPRHW
ncbi:LOW QUALITY PROTEIN: tenascin-X [Chelonoidis abingdonii]|uniref:LOW QUALITY PROTEIN: tenascin-X n=1 Tax=Chelonoidis abingdonii TaxID=106734 RepID=UPI003F49A195